MIRTLDERIYALISQWFKQQLQMVQLRDTIEPMSSAIFALRRERTSLSERSIFLEDKERGLREESAALQLNISSILVEEHLLNGWLYKQGDLSDSLRRETEVRQLEIRRLLAEKQSECSERENRSTIRRRDNLLMARQCTQKELELAHLNKKYCKIKCIKLEVEKHRRKEGIIIKLQQNLKSEKEFLVAVEREQQAIVARQVAAVSKYGDIALRLRRDPSQSSNFNEDKLRLLRSRLEKMIRKFKKDIAVKIIKKEEMEESVRETRESLDLLRMSILGLQGKLVSLKNSIQGQSRQRVKNLITLVMKQQANRYLDMVKQGSRISKSMEQRLEMKITNQQEMLRRLEYVAMALGREFPETQLMAALILDHTRSLKTSSIFQL